MSSLHIHRLVSHLVSPQTTVVDVHTKVIGGEIKPQLEIHVIGHCYMYTWAQMQNMFYIAVVHPGISGDWDVAFW